MSTHPGQSCFPDFTSLDVFEKVGPEGREFSHHLLSRNGQGPFVTTALLSGRFEAGKLRLRLTGPTAEISLPYNLYALLMANETTPISWQDYTRNCSAPGVSLFPGQAFDLTSVKINGYEGQLAHLIVWGRL